MELVGIDAHGSPAHAGMAQVRRGKRAMPLDPTSTSARAVNTSSGWCRRQAAELVLQFETSNCSQRAFAHKAGVPRSTLQHWLKRKSTLEADPALVAFFESPPGLAFLHRLVAAC